MRSEKSLLGRTLAVSFVWHVACLFLIGIVILPDKVKSDYTKVTFLGPILEKTVFEMLVDGYKPVVGVKYARSIIIDEDSELSAAGPAKDDAGSQIVPSGGEKLITIANVKDSYPFIIKKQRGASGEKDRTINKFIQGPAKTRKLIYMPQPPFFTNEQSLDFERLRGKFKIYIGTDGLVVNVEPVVSTGDPGVDLKFINYLRSWKFGPAQDGDKQENDWGVVSLDTRIN